jgi:hypothetical protein
MIQVESLSRLGTLVLSADRDVVMAMESALGVSFPEEYLSLLAVSNGFSPSKGRAADYSICLYRVEELGQMAAAYQVRDCLPGYIYIGSDGGGRGLFLVSSNGTSPVYICDHGALSPKALRQIAASLESWIEAECDLGDPRRCAPPERIDVVLARPPRGGCHIRWFAAACRR